VERPRVARRVARPLTRRARRNERLEQVDRVVELDFVFEVERLFDREQFAIAFAAGEFAEMQSFGAETLGDPEGRERGEIVEAADAPPFECLGEVGGGREDRERERAQELGLIAFGDDADT
jgi:hypothetical protein